jgi:hypothetical protein
MSLKNQKASSVSLIRHGVSGKSAAPVMLRAGAIRLVYDEGTIRAVMAGNVEIVRRIYVAVRDDIWNTVHFTITNKSVIASLSSFCIEFDCRHKKGNVDFLWHGSISGSEDSVVRFSLEGTALSAFTSNRIGFCVLHPLGDSMNRPCTIITGRGKKIKGRFPSSRFISPHQPFKNMRGISQKTNGIESHITFKGDTFEMEDQRNWTDASFKTYCPPLSRPHPFPVKKGDRFSQAIEIRVTGNGKQAGPPKEGAIQYVKIVPRSLLLPEIGCRCNRVPAPVAAGLSRLLCLSHARIDITVSRRGRGIARALRRAKTVSVRLGIPLEIALYFSKEPLAKQVFLLRDALVGQHLPAKRFLVFRRGETVTGETSVQTALPALRAIAPAAGIVSGTDAYFVEINRNPLPLKGVDGICYSVNPQVHTFDDQSILDNLEGQFYTVQAARSLGHGAPVYVTPITLRPRLNPDRPGKFHGPDARQKSLLGAVWTLGSIIRLAEAGAAGATYFELTGACGVMEHGGKRVYPLFHVIADVNESSGGTMRILSGGKRSGITGCLLEKAGRKRWLIANLTMKKKEIVVSGFSNTLVEKLLDETTFAEACVRPEAFRNKKGRLIRRASGCLKLKLLPYGIARLDD